MIKLNDFFWILPPTVRQNLYKVLKKKKYQSNVKLFTTVDEDGYSYNRNKELKCLFIHIPKTGGISLSNTLSLSGRFGHFHATTYQLYLSKKDFNEYFKFTIVRNPWDRLVSAFFFLKKGGITNNDKQFAQMYLNNIESFETFVTEYLHRKEILSYIHFNHQYKYICDHRNRLLVDYVGRFEDYENSYRYILNKLNLPYTELKRENINKTRTSYQNYYNPKTISIVGDIYKKDIKLLNYTFD